jgi:signal peptidase I
MNFGGVRKKMQLLDPFTYVDRFVIAKLEKQSEKAKLAVFCACLLFLAIASISLVPMFANSIPLLVILIAGLSFYYYTDRKEGLNWAIYISFAFVFAFVLFSAIGLLLGTSSPMVIVLSGSMEPLYHRGDVIILQGATAENLAGKEVLLQQQSLNETAFNSFATADYLGGDEIKKIKFNSGPEIDVTQEGSIVVYLSALLQKPIIHRVVAKLHAADGWFVLTKGDANPQLDQDCGTVLYGRPTKSCIQLYPVKVKQLQGKALGSVPFIGCFKLWLLDDLGSLIAKREMPSDFTGIC